VSSLLARGEDPKRIRILDIHPPLVEDLKTVQFIQTDVTNATAVDAGFTAPWPDTCRDGSRHPAPELTVFHTAANIRFYERHASLLGPSERVNVDGTKNVVNAARSVGASILIYTSSGSVAVRRSRFLLWPWESEPPYFVQVIDDDENAIPKRHDDFFSNYAATKIRADRIVRAADKTQSGKGVLRTGCIRPGNGIFGPRGDMLCGAYLVRGTNPTWISNIVQSYSYVENCALAHLCYEQRLAELRAGGTNPDIGGQAFVITDPGSTPTNGDVYTTIETLTDGQCHFPNLPPTAMLLVAHIIEMYYRGRFWLISAGFKSIAEMLPAVNGDLVNLQPSLFSLTMVHLIFDDSRARLPPEKGGLGYRGAWTTLQGLHKTVEQHQNGSGETGRRSDLAGVSLGWGMGKAQRAVAKVDKAVVDRVGVDPVKILSTKS
jgi:nucleoside-diphosphate-sugar epimerase